MALGHTFPIQVRRGYDESGRSVAMPADGSRVVISSPGFNGSSSGHVRIYDFDSSETSWTQVGQDIDGEAAGDESGFSVAMSDDGSRIAIGSRFNDENGSNSGCVRIYDFDSSGTPWTQVGQDIDGEAAGDESGFSVAMSADGSRVAIGSPHISISCDGSFTCACNTGYERDGMTCTDKNECLNPFDNDCTELGKICFNIVGSFGCGTAVLVEIETDYFPRKTGWYVSHGQRSDLQCTGGDLPTS